MDSFGLSLSNHNHSRTGDDFADPEGRDGCIFPDFMPLPMAEPVRCTREPKSNEVGDHGDLETCSQVLE